MPFRYRSTRASDVWGAGSSSKGHKFPLLTVTFRPPVSCKNPVSSQLCDVIHIIPAIPLTKARLIIQGYVM